MDGMLPFFKDLFMGFLSLYLDRTVKPFGQEVRRSEEERETTAGRNRTCVPAGILARKWGAYWLVTMSENSLAKMLRLKILRCCAFTPNSISVSVTRLGC